MTQPAAPRDDDDQRLAPVVNAAWAAGGAADPQAAGRAFAALAEASRLAGTRWAAFYRGAPLVRLLYARDDPPGPAILAAAEREGLVLRPREANEGSAGFDGEIAIVASRAFEGIGPTTPVLVLQDGGSSLRLAVVEPNGPRFDGLAAGRGDVAATPLALAEALLGPPRGVLERRKLVEYLGEDVGATALRFEYEALLRLIGERSPVSDGSDDAWDRAAAANAAASVDRGAILAALRAEYERADALALAYGRRWRSTLAARSFLLFATNLVSGFVGALVPSLSVVTLPVQFAATALIYLDQHISTRRRWRNKWIEYRRAAETTRIARFCVLSGAPVLASGAPSWIDWRLERALRRSEPTPPLSEADAARCLAYLKEVEIDRQIAYHHGAFRRFRRLDARLRRASIFALLATIAFGGALALVALLGVSSRQAPLFGAVGVALSAAPGLYAALNGLRNQLDVERQATRAARIGLALRRLRRSLAGAPPDAALARAAALRAAEIMRDDVSSWNRVMEIV
jgi:hypothetical protein